MIRRRSAGRFTDLKKLYRKASIPGSTDSESQTALSVRSTETNSVVFLRTRIERERTEFAGSSVD